MMIPSKKMIKLLTWNIVTIAFIEKDRSHRNKTNSISQMNKYYIS